MLLPMMFSLDPGSTRMECLPGNFVFDVLTFQIISSRVSWSSAMCVRARFVLLFGFVLFVRPSTYSYSVLSRPVFIHWLYSSTVTRLSGSSAHSTTFPSPSISSVCDERAPGSSCDGGLELASTNR